MKVLDLVLKGEWFDMIKNNIKHEEYREIKPYWFKRLFETINIEYTHYDKIDKDCSDFYCNPKNIKYLIQDFNDGGIKFKNYTHVKFRRGYTNEIIIFRIVNVRIDNGKTEWGAPTNQKVFIINFADKPLKEEFADIFNDVINNNVNDYYVDGKVNTEKLTELFGERIKELFDDYNMKFISNNNFK